MDWQLLTSEKQLSFIDELSNEQYCLIFKHSTRCSISTIAKSRLEKSWNFKDETIRPYYLDLISFREISNSISKRYAVLHQSPQILVIKNGISTYDASHLDILVKNIEKMISNDV